MADNSREAYLRSPGSEQLVFLGGRQVSSTQGKYGDWRWFDAASNDDSGALARSVVGARNLNREGGLWEYNQPK
jgi:hypothetical protein